MSQTKQSNIYGVYLLIAIAAAVGVYFISKPIYHHAQLTKDQAASVQFKINDLNQLKSDTDKLRSNFAAVQADQDKILRALPRVSEEELLLPHMVTLATASGVGISGLAISPVFGTAVLPTANQGSVGRLTGLVAYPFSFTASGSYAALFNFLGVVKASSRYLDVQSAEFAPVGTNPNNMSVKMTLNAYYQSQGGI